MGAVPQGPGCRARPRIRDSAMSVLASTQAVDAYARNLDRFLAWFADAPAERWVEAHEGDLLTYLHDLRNGRVPGIRVESKRALPQNVVLLAGSRIAEDT